MDPDKVLQEIIDMASDGDADGMMNVVYTLNAWLKGGGFPPKDPRKTAYDQGYFEAKFNNDYYEA